MTRLLTRLALPMLALLSLGVHAGTDGTYVLEGGSYVVTVDFQEGQLSVEEPNRTSIYRQQANGDYLTTNDQGVVYGIRVIDDSTIEAFKPIPGNIPTRLKLYAVVPGGGLAEQEFEQAEAVAQRYFELSETDSVNAQTWTQCAAAAMMKTMMAADQAHQGAVQAAMMLQMISTNLSQSPCPDAISSTAWAEARAGF